MLMSFSYFSVREVNISWRTVFKTLFLSAPLLYVLVYFVVSLQVTDLSIEKFNIYLLNRIGVGQKWAVFLKPSQFQEWGVNFTWHMIPGASFFVDYIPYDKMLMMVTEGYGYTQMGVKNSLFNFRGLWYWWGPACHFFAYDCWLLLCTWSVYSISILESVLWPRRIGDIYFAALRVIISADSWVFFFPIF